MEYEGSVVSRIVYKLEMWVVNGSERKESRGISDEVFDKCKRL